MKRKMRKFAEGDYVSTEGVNPNIDDDVRARALKFVEGASEASRDIGAPVTVTKTKTSVTAPTKVASTKPSVDMDAEKTRMESLVKKQALERVEPENYIPGTGLLKNMIKRGLKTIGADSTKQIGNQAVKQLENKATKMLSYDKAGDLASKRTARATARDVEMKRGNARNYGIDPDAPGSASALQSLRRNIGDGEFAMKKGGRVSSASKRADGCAVRGKTKA